MSGQVPPDHPEAPDPLGSEDEQRRWRGILEGNNPGIRLGRGIFRHIPSHTRCQLCSVPFDGPTAPVFRVVGKGAWPKNPKFCKSCFESLATRRGGAEIMCSLLFADVRNSTRLAEQMSPTLFHQTMTDFFEAASRSLVEHDAIVDKFVGDEIVGIFVPALSGERHAARAIEAAKSLIASLPHDPDGAALPVGVGVHTGNAFVGAVGAGSQADITAMGDTVNTAARIASAAGAGEILLSKDAAEAGGLDYPGLTMRELDLKGKSDRVTVFVLD